VLKVPLDYSDSDGRQITIPLARRAATDPANRIGTLLFIAGGPGVPGTDFVERPSRFGVPAALMERFDLVSFDPRGTPNGTGSPRVDCPVSSAAEEQLASLTPDDPADLRVDDVLATMRVVQAACEAGSDGILPYLSTASTIGDIERIRRALGEEQLSLIGQSYGTLVEALYADAHPDRVRATVLDAPVDPALDRLTFLKDKAEAAQDGLDGFLAWCADAPSCAPWSHGDPRAALDALVLTTLHAQGGLTAWGLRDGLFNGLLDHPWEDVAVALAGAAAGDTATLQRWSKVDGDPDWGSYADSVECPDFAAPADPAAYTRLGEALRSTAPDFADWAIGVATCVGWPQAAARDVGPVRVAEAPPILILSGTRDLLTPHAWAQSLEQELADATLLARDSKDHGSLFRNDPCIDAAVMRYLVDLAMPAKGTTCD
jgi:pimeloyl-ACP methyl ester carboxylesterase